MISPGTDLVRKDSIEELVGHRQRALKLYKLALDTMAEAKAAHKRACAGQEHVSDEFLKDMRYYASWEHLGASISRSLDKDMWRYFIIGTPLGSLMDAQERKKFEEQVAKEPPEVTVDTVFATMSRLLGEADKIFRRGLVNAFSNLSRDYKSHDGFKIGERIILSCVVRYEKSCNWLSTGSYIEEKLRDVDRVMYVLDGKSAPEYQQGICAALRQAVQDWRDGGEMECETDYWRLKFYKNGNGHLYPKRKDLIDRANKLIAEHYGEALGAAPDVANKRPEPPRTPDNATMDFFRTPPEIVQMMIDAADLEGGMNVLEPSAGEGDIAYEALNRTGMVPDCVELDDWRVQKLKHMFGHFGSNDVIRHCDFLELTPSSEYDRVLMNPPFNRGQYAMHVSHALSFLKPGGRLVAIMGAGIKFRQERLFADLRRRIEDMGGTITDLPEEAFKDSGTLARAVLVVVDAPA